MAASIIDGKAIAEQIRAEIVAEVGRPAGHGVKPGVATILVGEDGGAQFYRGQIEKNTATVASNYYNHMLPADTPQAEVLDLIAKLNADADVHGILALQPMQGQIDQEHRVQRHRAGQGPGLREPGQHRPRAARRPAVRAGHAVRLHRDPGPHRRGAAGQGRHDRQTTRTSLASRPPCSASTAMLRCTWCTCSARTCPPPAGRRRCSSAPRRS